MRKFKELPPLHKLRKLLCYDADSGLIGGEIYSAHRIAWLMATGEKPMGEIDHINGDPSDNRLCNLRIATSAQNNQNRRISSRNKTGIKGVFRVKWAKDWRWRACVWHNRGQYVIEHFVCFGEAIRRAKELRSSLHAEFASNGA